MVESDDIPGDYEGLHDLSQIYVNALGSFLEEEEGVLVSFRGKKLIVYKSKSTIYVQDAIGDARSYDIGQRVWMSNHPVQ